MEEECECPEEEVPKKRGGYKPPSGDSDPQPLFRLPHFLQVIGPKHVNAAKGFIPSMLFYGVASLIGIIYICDWKTVLQYMPYYNGKYPTKKDE